MPALAVTSGTSLFSSILGARASSSAANTQAQAAQQAANASLQAGQNAAGMMQDATRAATGAATDATAQGIQSMQAGTATANDALLEAIRRATGNQQAFVGAGNDAVRNLAAMFAPGGAGTQQFSFNAQDFQGDPGYQFQIEEGQRALERSAAARGAGPISGATMRALARYSQGLADQAYGSAYERAQRTFQMNRENAITPQLALAQLGQGAIQNVNAIDANLTGTAARNTADAGRFAGGAQINLGELIAGLGTRNAETSGRFLVGAQADANNARMGAANARAAGTMGVANAWGSGVRDIGRDLAGWISRRPPRQVGGEGLYGAFGDGLS
jgi:hypothetical protein